MGRASPRRNAGCCSKRFQRLDASDSQSVYGYGLGLYLSRRMLHAMQSDLAFEAPARGRGAFLFLFEGGSMKTKILLVDDDQNAFQPVGPVFAAEQFRSAGSAPTDRPACGWPTMNRPDLVLLDVMMPGMDGWEVCARLRELSDVPVIMLTAKAAEADKLRGFQLGVDDYVTKPYSFVELVARIQAVLGRVKKERKETGYIAHGEIVLNMEKYQATVGGRNLVLTPTEFRLLEVLVRRKGRVASES